MSKYADPLWQTNPVLAQVREALKEVEHIRMALLEIEADAKRLSSPAGSFTFRDFVMRMVSAGNLDRLDGWSSSLTESEIGLHAMIGPDRKAKELVQRRKRFLDEQFMKWSMILAGQHMLKIGTQLAGFLGGRP
jgi:hypothetical protein